MIYFGVKRNQYMKRAILTLDDVFKRVNDQNPASGAAILAGGGFHFILLHAHDETEELVPEYYRLFIEYLLEHGVTFERPQFR